jgi:hypothetical protein
MRDGVAPPTINLDNASVETAMDLVPHRSKQRDIDVVLSNSFGFGGTNASLVFRRVADERAPAPRGVSNKARPCRLRIWIHSIVGCALTQLRSGNVQRQRFPPLAIFTRNVGGSVGRFRWDATADRHTRVLPSCGGRAGRLPDGMRWWRLW